MTMKVSIVLPTCGRLELFRQALESCLHQTYRNLEIIVADDGSSDGTEAYVRQMDDPRVVFLRHPGRTGCVPAMNRGFARATGDHLTWCSDDDYYAPEAIGVMVAALDEDPGVDFVYTHYDMVDVHGRILRPGKIDGPKGLDLDNCVGHCFLYRRSVHDVVGAYSREPFLAEDYEYWLRVRARFAMKLLPGSYFSHRVHGASLTVENGAAKMLSAVARARRPYIPAWQHHLLVGKDAYYSRHYFWALGHGLMGLFFCPWKISVWRLVVLAILPEGLLAWLRSMRKNGA